MDLPFDEALAVADSALRHSDIDREDLLAALRPDTPWPVRRVLEHATDLAANPFESGPSATLIEADSWAHNAGRADHDADCRRYNALVIGGWTVLGFTGEQVMFSPHEVVATVRAALTLPVAS